MPFNGLLGGLLQQPGSAEPIAVLLFQPNMRLRPCARLHVTAVLHAAWQVQLLGRSTSNPDDWEDSLNRDANTIVLHWHLIAACSSTAVQ